MNKVILMGRLTRDVEMRQTPTGVSVARFGIAVNRRFQSKDGGQQADFINCAAWRQTGEFIARYFRKGSMIAVVGTLQSRSWDGQDGKKQYSMEVIVDEAYFTGSKAETGAGNLNQNAYGQGGYGAPQNNSYQSAPQNYGAPQQGGYNNAASNNPFMQADAAMHSNAAPNHGIPNPNENPFMAGFDDGGFSDIDSSEDDLPF